MSKVLRGNLSFVGYLCVVKFYGFSFPNFLKLKKKGINFIIRKPINKT